MIFGAESSDEDVLRLVVDKWQTLSFQGDQISDTKLVAKNPKRRQRETSKTLKASAASTKVLSALAEQREAMKK